MNPTNNLLRKSPTSPVVAGPPMFMKTIAVGPFDDVSSCVTGGATVAIVRACSHNCRCCECCECLAGVVTHLIGMGEDETARFESLYMGFRRAMEADIQRVENEEI